MAKASLQFLYKNFALKGESNCKPVLRSRVKVYGCVYNKYRQCYYEIKQVVKKTVFLSEIQDADLFLNALI